MIGRLSSNAVAPYDSVVISTCQLYSLNGQHYLFFLRKISLTNASRNNRQSPFLEPFSYNVPAVLVAILFNIDLYFYCVGLWFSREGFTSSAIFLIVLNWWVLGSFFDYFFIFGQSLVSGLSV